MARSKRASSVIFAIFLVIVMSIFHDTVTVLLGWIASTLRQGFEALVHVTSETFRLPNNSFGAVLFIILGILSVIAGVISGLIAIVFWLVKILNQGYILPWLVLILTIKYRISFASLRFLVYPVYFPFWLLYKLSQKGLKGLYTFTLGQYLIERKTVFLTPLFGFGIIIISIVGFLVSNRNVIWQTCLGVETKLASKLVAARKPLGPKEMSLPYPESPIDFDHSITLNAEHPFWTNTGVEVKKGDVVIFSASGKILWDHTVKEPWVGPAGASWSAAKVPKSHQFPLLKAPIACLIAKCGKKGRPFFVGKKKSIIVSRTGFILLALNERWKKECWNDNRGHFNVLISVKGNKP